MYQKLNKAISFIHQTSPKSNFNTYVGKNNLFNNLSLGDNLFPSITDKRLGTISRIFTTESILEEVKVEYILI